jgi:hypothetical protein
MSPWRYVVVYDWNMQFIMDDKEARTICGSSQGIVFSGLNLKEKYPWTEY